MKIHSINIRLYSYGELLTKADKVKHIKSLPFMSIVQSIKGSYDITLEGGKSYKTNEMGAFIAPRGVSQSIVHNMNKRSGEMRAHWIFIDIMINEMYPFEAFFDIPTLLPSEYNKTMYDLIVNIATAQNILIAHENIYKIMQIIMSISTEKEILNKEIYYINLYLQKNIRRTIFPQDLANVLNISTPALYRYFHTQVGLTPANYINDFRLQKASATLISSDALIKQVAFDVGFTDEYYFSKLYKKKFGVSPKNYRNSFSNSLGRG